MRRYVIAPLVTAYLALAAYGIHVGEAESKQDEIQQQLEREHGL